MMKNTFVLAGISAFATQVAAHATFQDLWVNGVDKIGRL
jgi:cellulase